MTIFDKWKLHRFDLSSFTPKTKIEIEKGQYLVKTVTTKDELHQALRLRFEVFHREMLGVRKATGIDVDAYDSTCDHLVIVQKSTGLIVGTYRLNCSQSTSEFYSANEFNLRRLLEIPGTKLELGRACIQKQFRTGIVISLLWRGIAAYMNAVDAHHLFGCATVKTENPREAALLYRHLHEQGRVSLQFPCAPTQDFHLPTMDWWVQKFSEQPLTDAEQAEASELIPSLFRAYLKSGASIGGVPAYDADFRCVDFLTILSKENLNRALWRKYEIRQSYGVPANSEISASI